MRKLWIILGMLLLALSWSCRKSLPAISSDEPGTLRIHTELDDHVDVYSKASNTTLQASDLTLEIFKEGVSIQKFAPIGDLNKEISLDPGEYSVQAYSSVFTTPAFDMPVYSDEAQVTIQSGSTSSAELICTQSNAGVRIHYDEVFQQAHSTYSVTISQQGHQLVYADADATRTGYFLPGEVTLVLTVDGQTHQQSLTLQAQRLYTLTIQDEAQPSGTLGLTLQIDPSYTEEEVPVFFPLDPTPTTPDAGSRTVLYHENFGTQATLGSYVTAYTDWETPSVSYAGTQQVIRPDTPSAGYSEASAGCCLLFPSANRSFTVSELNTAGATALELSFGLSSENGATLTASDIAVTVSTNESGVATPLPLTITAYGQWYLVSSSGNLPAVESLTIEIKPLQSNLLLDDLQISGLQN